MNKKLLFIFCFLAFVYSQTVLEKNKCSDCIHFKSQLDCTQNEAITDTCEWVTVSGSSKCQKKVDPVYVYKPYCQLIEKPESNCASTFGCAYYEAACSQFAGCSAYVKTSTAECQAISNQCIFDGTSCIEIMECKKYAQSLCETTPSNSGTKKCKWDTVKSECRDYVCSEADASLTTDKQCNDWLAGCRSKLIGCWTSPIPQCSTYIKDSNQCAYIGADGYCEVDTASSNCKAKECVNAPSATSSDTDCVKYWIGCITTGKGCIKGISKPACASYSGDEKSCVGYIGNDGICEGDVGGTKCRARKCENGKFATDELCKDYQNSCQTNGKQCVNARTTCSVYQGTTTTCVGYIGTDGYCKGTNETADAPCAPKVCDEAPDSTTTNDACNKYQIGCVTTGAGCVTKANLKSCTTYDGDQNTCQARVGSEGNCTWVSGTKCVARTCDAALISINQNSTCVDWFTNCVTTGAGCVTATTCDLTAKQTSCENTQGCAWQPVCTANDSCGAFKKKSICLATSARISNGQDGNGAALYVQKKCIWSDSGCRILECSDLIGTQYNNHTNCQNEVSTCMSNGVDGCITQTDCAKLKGTKTTCLEYPGYCSNTEDALEDAPCIARQCTDNKEAKDNQTCEKFLTGCISNGAGCVQHTTTCEQMQGTQETCNNLFGSLTGTANDYQTNQCYNTKEATETSKCQVKSCSSASGLTNPNDCSQFGDGCVYNGKGGCIDPSNATCADYTGDAKFCEAVKVGDNDTKYCFGSGGVCKKRECTDNSTAEKDEDCDLFMKGCVAKYEKGCISLTQRKCNQQQGTTTTCSNFKGGKNATDKVKCVKYDQCAERTCADKTNATKQEDCTGFKPKCRFLKVGTGCIDQNTCANYNVPDAAASVQSKFDYCSQIKDSSGKFCGYATGNKCADRTCDQLNISGLTTKPQCTQYLTTCKSAGNICYLPNSDCTTYTNLDGANTNDLKKTQCTKYVNTSGAQCSFITDDTKCSPQSSCDTALTSTDASQCNDAFASSGKCQKAVNGNGCVLTTKTCSSYKNTQNLTLDQMKQYCSSLKIIVDDTKFGNGDAVYKPCTIGSDATACGDISLCTQISGATQQKDCDNSAPSGKPCYYFNGNCYDAFSACPNVLPDSLASATDTQKSLYCISMYNSTDKLRCQLKDDRSGCENNVSDDCSGFTIPTTTWDGVIASKTAFCLAQSNKDKSMKCIKSADGPDCTPGRCEDIPNSNGQGYCDNYKRDCVYFSGICHSSRVFSTGDCAKTNVPFEVGVQQSYADTDKTKYCQMHFKRDSGDNYCTYDQYNPSTQTACVDAGNCSSYSNLPTTNDTDKSAYCLSKINGAGQKCGFTNGEAACRDFICEDIINVTSQVECDLAIPGKKCKYYKGTCVDAGLNCDGTKAQTSNKMEYCNGLTQQGQDCTYLGGAKCNYRDNCYNYALEDYLPENYLSVCETFINNNGGKCTYMKNKLCINYSTCEGYFESGSPPAGPDSGKEEEQCRAVPASNGPCTKQASTKCRQQYCTDNDGNETACNNPKLLNCVYYQTQCLSKDLCGNYTPVGASDSLKQTWCEGIKDTYGNFCKWNGTKCAQRQCSDKQFYTNQECQAYSNKCKTDGFKCVDISKNCNEFKGQLSFCESLLDSTGLSKCKLTTSLDATTSACQDKTCYDNVTATSDDECDKFLSGCVTRGVGCVPNDMECTSYKGTKAKCETFKQVTGYDDQNNPIFQHCSGDVSNTDTSICRLGSCDDNTTAVDDKTCVAFIAECLTNGKGCINKTEPCTSYQGTQAVCSKFKGSNQTEYCWNVSSASATTPCTKKKCSDIVGSNDDQCNQGLKSTGAVALCIYDGTGCTENGKDCTQFTGTDQTCPTFKSNNGPCKASSSTKGPCAKRVCTEAPNSYATDTECQKYHPDCYTTGFGCTSSQSCTSLSNETSCSQRPECSWTHQCYNSSNTCSTYSNTTYTQCNNVQLNNGQLCTWVESTNTCRQQTCEDQPVSYTTHDKCKQYSDTCTTTGAGCITRTTCNKYTNQSTCLAASVNADGTGRCGWTTTCRDRLCTDLAGKTDDECNKFLAGCKTNGNNCVSGALCSDYVSAQYCQSSTAGPCLWVDGICFNFSRCENALRTTHTECQQFSTKCTSNGTNCIPITTCSLTKPQIACVTGTDGQCGWLPEGKCQVFGACSDVIGSTNDVCQAYGANCISDGVACVMKVKCADYKTSIACTNQGTDGICFWNETACKLKECSDVKSITYPECQAVAVTGSTCTTNGINCIPLSTCSTYVEAGCYFGTDGECIFALPVGSTTGDKKCRLKQCQDIQTDCSTFTNQQCVSNGTSCIPKAACTSYKTVSACNGGGLDGTKQLVCAFTPGADKVNGQCKVFGGCSDANSDQLTCQSNPACKWTSTDKGTTCTAHDCASFAPDCKPLPSFDGLSHTVCLLINGQCKPTDPGSMTDQSLCYVKSSYAYTWNQSTSKCESCATIQVNNNTTNQINQTNTTTTDSSLIIKVISLALLGLLI